MALCDAWEACVDERAEELRELGHLCPWSRVTLHDSDYRSTDVTVIPVYEETVVATLVGALVQAIPSVMVNFRSSYAPVLTRTHLQMMGNAHPTLVIDHSIMQNLPITYSASLMNGPMLMLPVHMAPMTHALRANLFPDHPVVVPMPVNEAIVITSND